MHKYSTPHGWANIRRQLPALALLAGAMLVASGSPATAASTSKIKPGDAPRAADPRPGSTPHSRPTPRPGSNPKLGLTETGGPATGLRVGQKVTHTYRVTNQSTGTTTPITGLAVTGTVTGINCQATSLAPGASTTCTGTYTVAWGDVPRGRIVSTAQASGRFGNERVLSNTAAFTVTTNQWVPPRPVQVSLSIDKKAWVESDCRNKCQNDGSAAVGDKIFYTYRVANTGTMPVTNVAVSDPTAGPVDCNTTTLAPGTSTDCHARDPHVVTWFDVKAGKVVNTGRATGNFYKRTVVSDPATVTICIRDGKSDHGHDGKDGKHDKDGGKDGKHDKDGGKDGKHDKHDGKNDKPVKHEVKQEAELPVTGGKLAGTVSLGGGLLAVGALLLGVGRPRRKVNFHV
jgi:uncharacterized repeat protein (TIGR01451 family)